MPTPRIVNGLVSVCGVCEACAKDFGPECVLWLNAKELREYIASLTAALGEIDKRPAIVVGVDPAAPGGDRTTYAIMVGDGSIAELRAVLDRMDTDGRSIHACAECGVASHVDPEGYCDPCNVKEAATRRDTCGMCDPSFGCFGDTSTKCSKMVTQ